jgi:hypothetical protein
VHLNIYFTSVVLLIASASLSCDSGNPYFCKGRAHDSCLNEAGEYPCQKSADCSGQAGTLVCDAFTRNVEFGVCRQCTELEADACQGATPVCGSDSACRACKLDSECSSKVCDASNGACVAETAILYVDATGTGSQCTRTAPCDSFSKAVGIATTARATLWVAPGSYSEKVSIDDKGLVIAAVGASLSASSGGQIVDITGSSRVAIRGLRIHSGLGNNGDGLRISDKGGNSPAVTIHQVTIDANGGKGISASGGGSVSVSQSTISANTGGGISASGGSVSVSQSTISANTGGGISVQDGTFEITNNVIVGNGSADMNTGSSYGGLSVSSPGNANVLQFNTVAFNHAKSTTLLAAGIACSVTNLVASGNIVTSNNEGLAFPPQTKGACTYGSSFTAPGSEMNTLRFKNIISNPPDFHLTAESPSSVLNAGGTCTGLDIDGDSRPQGGACDLGADEFKP